MRFGVAALCAAAAVASAAAQTSCSPPEVPFKNSNSIEGKAESIAQNFLNKNYCEAWGSLSPRRLSVELPDPPSAECSAACPKLEGVMTELQENMMEIMMGEIAWGQEEVRKVQKEAEKAQSLEEMMKAEQKMNEISAEVTMRMIPKLVNAVFGDMCSNQNTYVCMASTEACTVVGASILGGMAGTTSSLPEEEQRQQLGCFCNTCPQTQQLYMDDLYSQMKIGELRQANRWDEEGVQDAMCPLIQAVPEVESCYKANTPECDVLAAGLTADFEFSKFPFPNGTNYTVFCDGWSGAARPIEIGVAATFLAILAQLAAI